MRLRLCIANFLILFALSATAFSEQEVSLVNPKSGLLLAGTLSTPDNRQPKALIVTATGSGSQDRDESLYGHRPFRAIAHHLSDLGYAVLRMDDRGIGGSEAGDLANVTTFDFANDIECAMAYGDSIFGGKVPIGVLGHSEGGVIAEHLAATNPKTDFIITLGAPAFKGDSVLLRQVRETLTLAGAENQFEKLYPSLRRRYNIVMGPGIKAIIEAQVMAELSSSQPEIAAVPQLLAKAQKEVSALCSPWMRTFLRHDPATDIARITVPWLALNGSIDCQVTPDNLQLIAKLCPSATVIEMPSLNHMMLKGISGSIDEYPKLSGDIDQSVLQTIADWLDNLTANNQSR